MTSRMLLATVATPFVVGLIAFTAVFAPVAHAAPVTESRPVAGFDSVAVSGAIDLTVRSAAQEALTLEGEPDALARVETVVENGRLVIRPRPGITNWSWNRAGVKARVDVVRLSAVSMAGSGDVRIEPLKTPALKLSLSGSNDARLDGLDTERLEVSISGSGDIRASGRAATVRLSVAGSGDAALADLVADDVGIKIAGSGDAHVQARSALDVSVAGSGSVRYRGDPPRVKTSIAGSGSVRRE